MATTTSIPTFPTTLHLSLAIVTFYRKSFTFSSHGLLCLLSLLAALLPSISTTLPPSTLLGPLLTFLIMKQLQVHMKTLDIQDILNFLVVLVVLLHLPPAPLLWPLPLLLSPLQLLRRPAGLARLLRPLRVAAGPASILTAVLAAAAQLRRDCSLLTSSLPSLPILLSLTSSVTVLASAVTAGVIFRPDNTAVLEVLLAAPLPSYAARVEVHAVSNALVLLTILARLAVPWIL